MRSGGGCIGEQQPPDNPSVAVVIPCYNAEKWIARAIQSALDQSYPNFEVIVIDDGSTDGSLDIIRSFGDRIRWETGANRGACTARNRGLALTEADYVLFLDADDYVEGEFLRSGSQALGEADADMAFCGFWLERSGQDRTLVDHYDPVPTPWDVFNGWLDFYSQPPCSVLWRADFVRAIGGWDARVRKNQDGELAMRAMLHEPVLCHFSGGAGVYSAHDLPSLSKSARIEDLRSEFEAMCRLLDQAKGTAFEHATRGLCAKLYIIARGAYVTGDAHLGRAALALSRALGQTGHIGTFAHRIVSFAIGLERKTALASRIRQLRW